ncbi:MAG: rRNA pseudouridine synthase [Lachnospiraceae bacterium]|nr:rRNA pseudouridine synthase [Lachnospiraceae bacterium]
MANIRLDKFLADAGAGTRSQVKELIKKGRVKVNNVIVKKSDIKIQTDEDFVSLDDKKVSHCEFQYFMLNKPGGVVSATKDEKEKTVIDLIDVSKRRDLFPVGRLDKDTEGLLIITNDGVMANKLLAPGKHVNKTYFAKIEGCVTDETVEMFSSGIDIGDDKLTKPAILQIISVFSKEEQYESEVKVTITEGRYHQIKRMFEKVGMKVTYLKRISMGPIFLDEALTCGEYRELTQEEIELLKNAHQ